jgi:hypothetical protein
MAVKVLAHVCEVCRNWGKDVPIHEYKIKFPDERAYPFWLCAEHAAPLVKIREAAEETKAAMSDGYIKKRGRTHRPD